MYFRLARKQIPTSMYIAVRPSICQNIDFIDQYDPEYLLVLSGDHIYKMNYDKMLAFHKERQADATIAVIEVPLKEASRFGIMNTDDGRIVSPSCLEKPPDLRVILPLWVSIFLTGSFFASCFLQI